MCSLQYQYNTNVTANCELNVLGFEALSNAQQDIFGQPGGPYNPLPLVGTVIFCLLVSINGPSFTIAMPLAAAW